MDTKRRLLQGSQSSRRSSSLYALSLSTVDNVADMREHAVQASPHAVDLTCHLTQGSISSSASSIDTRSASSTFSASVASSSRGAAARASRRTQEPTLTNDRMFGPTMNEAEATKIITAEVKAILARGEPPTRLLDDYVRAALIVRHPALEHFLPHDPETIFNNYIIPIDISSTQELEGFIKKLPGYINISLDGATVNGKQKVRNITYTGLFIIFNEQRPYNSISLSFKDCVHSLQRRILNFPYLVQPWQPQAPDRSRN